MNAETLPGCGVLSPGYGEVALRHMRDPQNHERLDPADGYARTTGPCGDTMEFWIRWDGSVITAASFTTDGCGATVACGSLVTVTVTGMTLEEAATVDADRILGLLGGLPDEVRHCALLAATAFAHARRACAAGGKASRPT